jgi:hypothetical protein
MKNVQSTQFSPGAMELQAQHGKPAAPVIAANAGAQAAQLVAEMKSHQAVDAEAGVRELAFQNRTLEQRRVPSTVRPAQPRSASRDRTRGQPSGKTAQVGAARHAQDEAEDWDPVPRVLNLLREDSSRQGRGAAEAMLAERFDTVQSYNALLEALREAEEMDGLSAYKKKTLKGALNEMMSDMMQSSSGDLRKTLQEAEDLHGALESMAEEPLPSTRDLRFLIGGRSKGKVDVPLTPLTMLKAMIRNFGARHCMSAMESLRSRMMSGF